MKDTASWKEPNGYVNIYKHMVYFNIKLVEKIVKEISKFKKSFS